MKSLVFYLISALGFICCKPAPEESETKFFFSDGRHPCVEAISKNREGFIVVSIGQFDTSALEGGNKFKALSACVEKVNEKYEETDNVKASDVCGIEVKSGMRSRCMISEKLRKLTPTDANNTGKCQLGDTWDTVVPAGSDSKEVCKEEYLLIFKDISGKKNKSGAYCSQGSAYTAVAVSPIYADLTTGYQPVTCKVVTRVDSLNFEQAPTKPGP